MRHDPEPRAVAGEDPRLLWFANECRRNGIRLESCVRLAENAGDPELAEFFERAHFASHTALVEGDVYDERGWSGGQLR